MWRAKEFEFERAASLRDQVKKLKKLELELGRKSRAPT